MSNVKKVSVRLPLRDYKKLEKLVANGGYTSIEDAIRTAVRRFLAREEGNGELA